MYRIIGADGREYGPISADQVRQWIAEGRVNAVTSVRTEGSTEWKYLGMHPEFSMLFSSPAGLPGAIPGGAGQLPKTNSFAITGFIFGLLSFFTLPVSIFCCCFSPLFTVPGVIFSVIGLAQIRRDPQLHKGKAFAIVGVILSVICVLVYLALLALGIISSHWQQDFSNHAHRL
jgi:hypothetical protein